MLEVWLGFAGDAFPSFAFFFWLLQVLAFVWLLVFFSSGFSAYNSAGLEGYSGRGIRRIDRDKYCI